MVNGLKLHVDSNNIQSSHRGFTPQFQPVTNGSKDKVKYLYQILAQAPYYNAEVSGIDQFLRAGCQLFGADYALLMRSLSQQVVEVMAVNEVGGQEEFYIGQHLHVENTPTATVFEKNETCTFKKVPSMGEYSDSFAYNDVEVNAYLGTVVAPSSVDSLAICFFSPNPKETDFSSEDIETLELLAEGVACMIDLQKAQAQRKMTDQAMFALGSVKTLDEYLQQAKLPEVYGVPARVVEVLQRRIGHAPLSIGHIAEELNLSKRTLQRRLQQQDISFAELRDQVRFHYSIDYLIKQHLSIDSISASLDFSDRTSFTNAFKRWTGLSPSTFRKLFRDYV
jgi:AraC-like DNA-binding protein